jgi:hypothetical protein
MLNETTYICNIRIIYIIGNTIIFKKLFLINQWNFIVKIDHI